LWHYAQFAWYHTSIKEKGLNNEKITIIRDDCITQL
jgi:hypothetical protein